MIAVIQRILNANVIADGLHFSECSEGLLVLLGVSIDDTIEDANLIADKLSKLRIFEDENGKLNKSVNDIQGNIMVVPNFTLLASYKKGNRPDFLYSAKPESAELLFNYFCDYISKLVPSVSRGKFRSDMKVSLINNGPITMIIDSRVLKGERTI